jgi:RNA polymerase sigma factor (sigma-70 family)
LPELIIRMPRFDRIAEDSATANPHDRITLDERFVALFLPETPLDRVESQELRQIVLYALQQLTPQELKVVEGRYQHKRSPGAVASHLHISKDEVRGLERSALDKLRKPLIEYMET